MVPLASALQRSAISLSSSPAISKYILKRTSDPSVAFNSPSGAGLPAHIGQNDKNIPFGRRDIPASTPSPVTPSTLMASWAAGDSREIIVKQMGSGKMLKRGYRKPLLVVLGAKMI